MTAPISISVEGQAGQSDGALIVGSVHSGPFTRWQLARLENLMPLFHDAQRGEQPSVHALIIGVGGYVHLPGNSALKTKIHKQVGRLQPLISPPRSAREFAEWLTHSKEWPQPLGTIDLLISPEPSDTGFTLPANVRPATISNVRQAFSDWLDRCNEATDNVAVFYFCGHGMEKADHYLLAEDFGANPNDEWLGSFAFDQTREAFHKCQAQTQCFFVDACRQMTPEMLTNEPNSSALTSRDWTAKDCLNDLTLKAAVGKEMAFGPKLTSNAPGFGPNNTAGISYFTQALIRSLDGAAAIRQGKQWQVQTSEIAANINKVLRLVKKTSAQRCEATANSSATLRTLSHPPKVRIELSCDPEIADHFASLWCSGPQPPGLPAPYTRPSPWKGEDVEAGTYVAQAIFVGGPYTHTMENLMVMPPIHRTLLECK